MFNFDMEFRLLPLLILLCSPHAQCQKKCKRKVVADEMFVKNGLDQCIPPVCGTAHLNDIPQAAGTLPISLALQMRLHDTAAARAKLAGKCLVLLGDSTMVETTDDLVLLLSGLANQPHLMDRYISLSTHRKMDERICIPLLLNPYIKLEVQKGPCSAESIDVHFHAGHRNMTILMPAINLHVRMRWAAHHLLHGNKNGIRTFFEKSFTNELNTLLYRACDGRKPDLLVINSGWHNDDIARDSWEPLLWQLSTVLKNVQMSGTQVVWKGNFGRLQHMEPWRNDIAKRVMLEGGFTYVDVDAIVKHLQLFHHWRCFSPDDVHYGSVGRYHNATVSILFSSMMLQSILNAI